ncbi:hypothetical protein RB195_016523 [Necator americanus]
MSKKVHFKYQEKTVEEPRYDEDFCCRVTYKGASGVVIVLESLYLLYYILILVFASVNHRQAWSIVVISVNLFLLFLQIVVAALGVWKEQHRLLQTHVIFLSLTLAWDLIMTTGFFILAVYPSAKENKLINYKGAEFNARIFGIVMGCAMILFFVLRILTTWIIWKYWCLLRAKERQGGQKKYSAVLTDL